MIASLGGRGADEFTVRHPFPSQGASQHELDPLRAPHSTAKSRLGRRGRAASPARLGTSSDRRKRSGRSLAPG